jgi:hypothetical protein
MFIVRWPADGVAAQRHHAPVLRVWTQLMQPKQAKFETLYEQSWQNQK